MADDTITICLTVSEQLQGNDTGNNRQMHKQKRKETLTALSTQIMVSDAITDQE